MFALLVFGTYLERKIGSKKFLFIYLISGILGNVAYFLTSPFSNIPALGASGAIYGTIGTLAMLEPSLIVYVNFFFPMPLIFLAFLWILLSFIGMFIPSSIAHQAHLAGLLFGLLYGYILRKRRRVRYYYYFV